MACDAGIQERIREVMIPIRGEGTCPEKHNYERFESQDCNTHDCAGDEFCIASQDLIIVLDGSGSLRQEGFVTLQNFAANLTDRYLPSYLGDAKIQLGYVLFGNGHLLMDGTVTPAILGSELTSDIAQVKVDILTSKWQRGFTNLAQGFVQADTMFQQKGRSEAQSAVLVIWDGKYSFAFETGQKARALKDKNTMIYMAPVAERIGEDHEAAMHRWASFPWETNYEHIPGLFELSTNMDVYIQKLIVKFCPMSFSPSNFVKQDDMQGYTIIKEKGRPHFKCSQRVFLGQVKNADECAGLARDAGTQVFVVIKLGGGVFSCKSAPQFAPYDMAAYRTFISKASTGDSIECPEGRGSHQGWTISGAADTYALIPAIG